MRKWRFKTLQMGFLNPCFNKYVTYEWLSRNIFKLEMFLTLPFDKVLCSRWQPQNKYKEIFKKEKNNNN